MRITLTAEDKKKKINNPQKVADIMSKILEAEDKIEVTADGERIQIEKTGENALAQY